MSENELIVRPLKHWDEYLAAEHLQLSVWKMSDWRDAVPANLLITMAKNGGIVLGAFDRSTLIGFVFSFIGLDQKIKPPRLKQCSHMLAVIPDYQSRKLGACLKFAQRQAALAQDIDLMTWTYDPLLALNGNLNLVRLGAIARRYVPDAYGEMNDGLNAGISSDRFEVEWWLRSPRVIKRAEAKPQRSNWDQLIKEGAQPVLSVRFSSDGYPRVEKVFEPTAETLIAEVPAQMSELKNDVPDLAHEWRAGTRDFFARAFDRGYACVDFVLTSVDGHRRAAYVLSRAPLDLGIKK